MAGKLVAIEGPYGTAGAIYFCLNNRVNTDVVYYCHVTNGLETALHLGKTITDAQVRYGLSERTRICRNIILPALSEGRLVLYNKFTTASLAIFKLGMPDSYEYWSGVEELCRCDTENNRIQPELTIFIDISPDRAFERMKACGIVHRDGAKFYKKMREAYFNALDNLPRDQVIFLNGEKPEEKIYQDFLRALANLSHPTVSI